MKRKHNVQNLLRNVTLGRSRFLRKNKKSNRGIQIRNTHDLLLKLSKQCDFTKIAGKIDTTLQHVPEKKERNLPKLTLTLDKSLSYHISNHTLNEINSLQPLFEKMTLTVSNDGQMASYNPVIEVYSLNYLLYLHSNQSIPYFSFEKEYIPLDRTLYQEQKTSILFPTKLSDITLHLLLEPLIAICYDVMLDPKPNIKNLRTTEEIREFAESNRQMLYIPPAVELHRIDSILHKRLFRKKLNEFTYFKGRK